MQLTNRETATVLAALRYWQEKVMSTDDPMSEVFVPASLTGHFHEELPLGASEIDSLCERINFDGPATILIRGGIAYLPAEDSQPVTVRDYDIDGADGDLTTDSDGFKFHEYQA